MCHNKYPCNYLAVIQVDEGTTRKHLLFISVFHHVKWQCIEWDSATFVAKGLATIPTDESKRKD